MNTFFYKCILISMLQLLFKPVNSQSFEVNYTEHPHSSVKQLLPLDDGFIVHAGSLDEAFIYRYDTMGTLLNSMQLDVQGSMYDAYTGSNVELRDNMIYHFRCLGGCDSGTVDDFRLKKYDLQFNLVEEWSHSDFQEPFLFNSAGCGSFTLIDSSLALFNIHNTIHYVDLLSNEVIETVVVPEEQQGQLLWLNQDSLLIYGMYGITLYDGQTFSQLTNQTVQRLYRVEDGFISSGYPNVIRKWDLTFNEVATYGLDGSGSFDWNLNFYSQYIYAVAWESFQPRLIKLDSDLNESEVLQIPWDWRSLLEQRMFLRDKIFLGGRSGSLGFSAALKEVSLDLTSEDFIHDIGITDVHVSNVSLQDHFASDIQQWGYLVFYDAVVTMKNYSDSLVHSAVVTAQFSDSMSIESICASYAHYFPNYEIQPNESVTISLENVYLQGLNYFEMSEGMSVEVCISCYGPNQYLDDDYTNNQSCVSVPIKWVDVKEHRAKFSSVIYRASTSSLEIISKREAICTIYDVYGRLIYQTRVSNGTHHIELNELSYGTYLVKVDSGDSAETTKIVVH
jgi:hypothetical protein